MNLLHFISSTKVRIDRRKCYRKHHKTLISFKVGPTDINGLVAAIQPLLESPIVVLQNDGVQSPRHNHFYLFCALKKTASEDLQLGNIQNTQETKSGL